MLDNELTRRILHEIDGDPAISQKRLSEQIGISVGMINWHIKRCVGKGLIKLQHAPVRRYLYYLTPDGFAEKAKLTASYLQASFNMFRVGREQYEALFSVCRANGWANVVLFGNTEITDLALLVRTGFKDVTVVGVIDRNAARADHSGTPVVRSAEELRSRVNARKLHAAIACHYLASIDGPQTDELLGALGIDRSRFLIPGFLQ